MTHASNMLPLGATTVEEDQSHAICESLDWDTQFFGVRIARLKVRTLTPETALLALAWCAAHRIACLYFLADPGDRTTVRTAEDHGFRLVDIRTTLGRRTGGPEPVRSPAGAVVFREWTPWDLPALLSMAKTGFHLTRFYFDPGFPERQADALYETWLEKSCHGYADAVLVAADGKDPVGCITLHLDADNTGRIGLVCCSADWQGRGVGRGLVNAGLAWFGNRGAEKLRVVTQGRNCNAVRLYERCGFATESVDLWYHRWFRPEAPNE